jgi:hypothetical protein
MRLELCNPRHGDVGALTRSPSKVFGTVKCDAKKIRRQNVDVCVEFSGVPSREVREIVDEETENAEETVDDEKHDGRPDIIAEPTRISETRHGSVMRWLEAAHSLFSV